jgi:hypothetical protein
MIRILIAAAIGIALHYCPDFYEVQWMLCAGIGTMALLSLA